MSRLLFQGVPGVADESESLRTTPYLCHPERVPAKRGRVEGPAFAFPSVPSSLVPQSPQFVAASDKLHEEGGAVAIYGPPDAAAEAYLSLYALQDRGQESAGIATADGHRLANIKGMGLVSEIFTS